MTDQELTSSILREIDLLLKKGVLPVTVDHLGHLSGETSILEHLMSMKGEGLISGDLIRIGAGRAPHRMTNIRLTYAGIRALAKKPA